MPVNVLFIADIVGKPGRQAVSQELHRLVDRYAIDVVIANGENAAGGFGITEETAKELFGCGIHLLTSGNHIWDKKDSLDFVNREPDSIRNQYCCAESRGTGFYESARMPVQDG
jgi:calcineurin-like phosphoesterase